MLRVLGLQDVVVLDDEMMALPQALRTRALQLQCVGVQVGALALHFMDALRAQGLPLRWQVDRAVQAHHETTVRATLLATQIEIIVAKATVIVLYSQFASVWAIPRWLHVGKNPASANAPCCTLGAIRLFTQQHHLEEDARSVWYVHHLPSHRVEPWRHGAGAPRAMAPVSDAPPSLPESEGPESDGRPRAGYR